MNLFDPKLFLIVSVGMGFKGLSFLPWNKIKYGMLHIYNTWGRLNESHLGTSAHKGLIPFEMYNAN